MSASIIIPAFNEEATISATLTALIPLLAKPNIQIIVVCNGCTDNTAQIVKQIHPNILCLETEIGSKTHALNLGDEAALFFPRIYLDADIILSPDTVNAMVQTFEDTACLATSVEPQMHLTNSSWLVCAFYDVWLRLPYCKAGMIGSGVYALSKQGRARFDKFPAIIADDGFVRCQFTDSERPVTKNVFATVKAPKEAFSLIKIKTRSRMGRYELKDKFPQLLVNETKNYNQAFYSLFFQYKLWPKIVVYLSINLISRMRANRQYTNKTITTWERDESSRNES